MTTSPEATHCAEPDCDRRVYARGWCAMHYKRWLRTGSPVRGERPATCAVDGCERARRCRDWCHAHYQRWRAHGDVQVDRPLRAVTPCRADQCERPSHARGYCQTHYKRLLATGEVREADPIRIVTGKGSFSHGYWKTSVPEDDRWLTGGASQVGEHRYVMAKHLGRPLAEDEVVHHVNGDRTDNRLDNLELWSTAHPKGQRVEDKVVFAIEMLQRLAPERLRPQQS